MESSHIGERAASRKPLQEESVHSTGTAEVGARSLPHCQRMRPELFERLVLEQFRSQCLA